MSNISVSFISSPSIHILPLLPIIQVDNLSYSALQSIRVDGANGQATVVKC